MFLACSAVPTGGLGRERGYVDVDLYGTYAEGLLDGRLPYRDVFVEYPPGAFVVLVPPALVTDDHYRSAFKILMTLVALGGLWCVARLLVALGAGRLRLALGLGFVALSPLLLGSVWLNSYDVWPAALTAAALLAVVMGLPVLGFACLGLAFAAKVYAVVLVVPAAIYVLARSGWRRLAWCAGSVRRCDCRRVRAVDRGVAGRDVVEHPLAARARPARGEPRRFRSTRGRPARRSMTRP